MKKLLIPIVLISFVLSACNSGDGYVISGKIQGITEGKVYLSKFKRGEQKIDSATLVNGMFEFTGKTDAPDSYFIEFEGHKGYILLFLENSKISITADIKKLREAQIEGSSSQEVYKQFLALQKSLLEKQKALSEKFKTARKEKNQAALDSLDKIYKETENEKMLVGKKFLKENSNSVASGFIAYNSFVYYLEADELEEVYNLLGENAKSTSYGFLLKEKIDILKTVAIGQPAPDFTLSTPEGTPFSLSSLKGKIVVIDFWASWCGPCRRENPHMVELYKDVHGKGVEFLGVSLDKKKERWVKAIEDDQLQWHHVSDLKYWKSEAAKLYGINSIPSTVVVDKDGNIAAKKVFGDELKAEIKKLLQ